MAEGTYEYECMRAELLGTEKPDYDEFMRKKGEQVNVVAEEEIDLENVKEVDLQEESAQRISGGLDELNTILQVTQRKINRFKASCGSLTSLLRIKIGHGSSSDSLTGPSNEGTVECGQPTPTNSSNSDTTPNGNCTEGPRKSDLARALDNHVDRLDAMIEKAENAQYSMAHQSKEMKRFLD